MDIILFNECGLEIARESANTQEEIAEIISSWTINSGDIIKFE